MAHPGRHQLSKSTFIRGCQCAKSLWLHKHRPSLRDPLSDAQQAIFTRGTNVGVLARELFPGGVDASPRSPAEFPMSVRRTAELVERGEPVIYEAAFQHDGVLAALDILVRDGDRYRAFEVKSSTEISDTYLLDAALQYHVITSSGTPLDDISIIHINNRYVRHGALDLFALFVGRSVLAEVQERRPFVRSKIRELLEVARAPVMPEVPIGPHCSDPYQCDFTGHCWRAVPEYSVFDIARLGQERKFELYRSGIVNIADVPDDVPLSDRQRLQVEAERTGEGTIEVTSIETFLASISYPISFVDFEAFQPAVPLFDQSRPYQQIPFQFSLHRSERPGAEPVHLEFLAEGDADPRPAFIERLVEALGQQGSVVVYNRSFEVARLEEIAEDLPRFEAPIRGIIDRVVDLMVPFQRLDYYVPAMRGSYSIKSVLPALAPDLRYDGLAIADGTAASLAYQTLREEPDPRRRARLRAQLLEYCRLDSFAMVRLLDVLRESVGAMR